MHDGYGLIGQVSYVIYKTRVYNRNQENYIQDASFTIVARNCIVNFTMIARRRYVIRSIFSIQLK